MNWDNKLSVCIPANRMKNTDKKLFRYFSIIFALSKIILWLILHNLISLVYIKEHKNKNISILYASTFPK